MKQHNKLTSSVNLEEYKKTLYKFSDNIERWYDSQ